MGGNDILIIVINSFYFLISLEKIVLDYNELFLIENGVFVGLEESLKEFEFYGNYL